MAAPRALHGHGRVAERSGETLDLDTRPFLTRTAEAAQRGPVAAALLAAGAFVMLAAPITSDVVLPVGIVFAGWVMTRPVRLPFHTPERLRRKDHNDLDPVTNKPRVGAGRDYLGRDRFTGAEIWQSMKTSVQHRIFPGTTGAGKTKTQISAVVGNALAQGSGCIFVDGKGSPDVYTNILALAHQAGREDDVFVLSFLGSDSNTTNPFATASSDMIREILVGQLNEPGGEGSSKMFFGRALAFLGTIAPILRWIGDNKGIQIDLERLRDAMELSNVVRMARHAEIKFQYGTTNTEEVVSLEGCPPEYIRGIKNYLGDTGGFDVDKPLEAQKSDEPVKQHSYIAMQFTEVFTQWLISLGHIFRVPYGDVDIFDVVMNRRILVVLLPSLKNSAQTTQGLGKYVVAMLKATMGLVLGGDLEGDYADVIENLPSNAQSAFRVVLDEVGAYAANGIDNMLAMARQLNIEFDLGLQETGSLRAALGLKASAVLGNPNTVVGMRLQDPDTGDMIQRIGGETRVAQVAQEKSSQDIFDTFHPAEAASIQTSKRMNWLDLRDLKEGQAIISYGNILVHANMLFLDPPKPTDSRINRLLMITPPDQGTVSLHAKQVANVRMTIVAGPDEPVEETPLPSSLLGMLDIFGDALDAGVEPCLAALKAVLQCPESQDDPVPTIEDDEPQDDGDHTAPADHAFSRGLHELCTSPAPAAEFPDPGKLPTKEEALAEMFTTIELAGGRRGDAAKKAARQAIGGLRVAKGKLSPRPERVSNTKLLALIDHLVELLSAK